MNISAIISDIETRSHMAGFSFSGCIVQGARLAHQWWMKSSRQAQDVRKQVAESIAETHTVGFCRSVE